MQYRYRLIAYDIDYLDRPCKKSDVLQFYMCESGELVCAKRHSYENIVQKHFRAF